MGKETNIGLLPLNKVNEGNEVLGNYLFPSVDIVFQTKQNYKGPQFCESFMTYFLITSFGISPGTDRNVIVLTCCSHLPSFQMIG